MSTTDLVGAIARVRRGEGTHADAQLLTQTPVDVLSDVPGAAAAMFCLMSAPGACVDTVRRCQGRLGRMQGQVGLAELVLPAVEEGRLPVPLERIAGQILGMVGDRSAAVPAAWRSRVVDALWSLTKGPQVPVDDSRMAAYKGLVWLLPALSESERTAMGPRLVSALVGLDARATLIEALASPGLLRDDRAFEAVYPVALENPEVLAAMLPELVRRPESARTLFLHWAESRPWHLVPLLEPASEMGLQPFMPEDWPRLAENSFGPIRAHVMTCIATPQGRAR